MDELHKRRIVFPEKFNVTDAIYQDFITLSTIKAFDTFSNLITA